MVMSSQYHHGAPPGHNGMHTPHYAGHESGQFDREEEHYDAPPSYAATLESMSLGTEEENRLLLDQVDKLRECGVEKYIDLPQIVVVGNQSSGKSSVLNALTDIPFPRNSVMCTRFATQIRLRRTDRPKTTIKILPDKTLPDEEQRRLSTFKESIQDQADFELIFDLATHAIFPQGTTRFLSKSKLSIEISGPTQPHLTLVDLPGIIQSATGDQTDDDTKDILELAKYYMGKERTIILSVVSCGDDISNQAVLGIVNKLDPEGKRTLGVITKPDKTETAARELEFINLASNKDKRNKLQLGWHVLRNRTPTEMHFSLDERNETETHFFATTDWGKKLNASQLGVAELSKKLSIQLIRHIAAEVFKVQDEIETRLEVCREKLSQLGDGKDSPEEMKAELFRWCNRSARLTHAAVNGHGNPSGEDFFPSYAAGKTYERNFRSRVVKQNQAFADQMENRGSACMIIPDQGFIPSRSAHTTGGQSALPEIKRSDYINKMVYPMVRDLPGKELSMDTDPLLVYRLFRSYSAPWPGHAIQHVKDIHKICEDFLRQVLHVVWPKQFQQRIWSLFIQSKVDEMLKNAQTELAKLTADRLKEITPYESSFFNEYYNWKASDPTGQTSPEQPDQRYEEILRKMILLYQSNLKTFLTNVIVQVIERHIADGLEEVFHEERVRILKPREVESLVQEDYQVRTERQDLRQQETTLAEAKDICKEIRMRPDLGPYEYHDPKLQESTTSYASGHSHANQNYTHQSTATSHKAQTASSSGFSQPDTPLTESSSSPGSNNGPFRTQYQHIPPMAPQTPPRPITQNHGQTDNRHPVQNTSAYVNTQSTSQQRQYAANSEYERSGEPTKYLHSVAGSVSSGNRDGTSWEVPSTPTGEGIGSNARRLWKSRK